MGYNFRHGRIRSVAASISACMGATILVISSSSLRAQNPTAAPDINALHTRMDDALRRKDLNGVMAVYAPNYTEKQLDGKVLTRQQVAANWKRVFSQFDTYTGGHRSGAGGMKVVGNTGTVNTALQLYASVADKTGQWGTKGQKHSYMYATSARETWVQSSDKWLLQKSEDMMTTQVTVDGKPFPPGPTKPQSVQKSEKASHRL